VHGKNSGQASFHVDQDDCEDHDGEAASSSDPGSGMDFHSTQILSVVFDDARHKLTIVGNGVDNGSPVAFTVVLIDNGSPGLDVFSITLSDGYSNLSNLLDGSITLQ
jgi:hypothetical protein